MSGVTFMWGSLAISGAGSITANTGYFTSGEPKGLCAAVTAVTAMSVAIGIAVYLIYLEVQNNRSTEHRVFESGVALGLTLGAGFCLGFVLCNKIRTTDELIPSLEIKVGKSERMSCKSLVNIV